MDYFSKRVLFHEDSVILGKNVWTYIIAEHLLKIPPYYEHVQMQTPKKRYAILFSKNSLD